MEQAPKVVDDEGSGDGLDGLLAPALARDPSALRLLVDQVAPDVLRVVRLVLGWRREGDAEDVTQEALVAFVGALASFRGGCSLRRFARRVGARTAANHLRRAARRARHHERFVEQPHPRASEPFDESEEELRERLRALLVELPEAQAQALVLRVVLGCSIAEVAEACEVSGNTVRSRLRLAKEALRRRIEAAPELAELFGREEAS